MSAAIRAANAEAGGSLLELGEAEYAVRATGYLKNLDDFRKIPLRTGAGGVPGGAGTVPLVTGPVLGGTGAVELVTGTVPGGPETGTVAVAIGLVVVVVVVDA